MGRLLACAILLQCAAGEAGGAALTTSAWKDDFSSISRLSFSRHLVPRKGGGVTLTPAVQNWHIPADARFSAGTLTPGLEVLGRGTGREEVTLWQRILQPGRELSWARHTTAGGVRNGILYRDNPATRAREGFTGFPGLPGGAANAVGWDTEASSPKCRSGALGGISPFNGHPVLWGGALAGIAPGTFYTASFTSSVRHDGDESPYLAFEWVEQAGGKTHGSWTAAENDFAGPETPAFSSMAGFSVMLNPAPAVPGSAWDVRAVSRAVAEDHCTFLGPVYVTAQEGNYSSPVFDSLSQRTVWEKVEWELDQNYATADPACGCATPGNPITPAVVRFGVSDNPSPLTAQSAPFPTQDISDCAFPAEAAGRYFQFSVALHGRDTAGNVSRPLAPRDPHRHFAGWLPLVKKLSVRYRPQAARAVSARIAPASIRKWGRVFHAGQAPGGSRVRVDVLAADGTPLFEDVPSGFDFGGSLDPFSHAAVYLRADLIADPASPENRPSISSWRVTWEPLQGRLILDRASISVEAGEWVRGIVSVESRGQVRVRVRDAKGNVVATPLEAEASAEAVLFRWNGRGRDGAAVKPGTYFITAITARGAGTRKVRVEK